MPVVMREDGWRVVIYVEDHPPPHVHVKRPGGYVKIHLAGPDGVPEVVKIHRVPDHDAWCALSIVYTNQSLLLTKWREIHG